MGPGGLIPGNYNAQQLTQAQRQWLFNYFGNTGQAPVGYGGANVPGETSNYNVGETAAQAQQQNAVAQAQAAQSYVTPSAITSNAQALNQQIISANQPDISTLSTLYNPTTNSGNLTDLYNQTLQNIQSSYTGAADTATQGELTTLAQRGILPSSGYGEQQLSNALQPIAGQEASQYNTAMGNYAPAISNVTSAIGQLQAGNMTAAQQEGQTLGNEQASAAQYQSVLPTNISVAQSQALQNLASAATTGQAVTTANQFITNPLSGQTTAPAVSALQNLGYTTAQIAAMLTSTGNSNTSNTSTPLNQLANGATTNSNTLINGANNSNATSSALTNLLGIANGGIF